MEDNRSLLKDPVFEISQNINRIGFQISEKQKYMSKLVNEIDYLETRKRRPLSLEGILNHEKEIKDARTWTTSTVNNLEISIANLEKELKEEKEKERRMLEFYELSRLVALKKEEIRTNWEVKEKELESIMGYSMEVVDRKITYVERKISNNKKWLYRLVHQYNRPLVTTTKLYNRLL